MTEAEKNTLKGCLEIDAMLGSKKTEEYLAFIGYERGEND